VCAAKGANAALRHGADVQDAERACRYREERSDAAIQGHGPAMDCFAALAMTG